ncbi:MAG TPA: S8 family serine peptidase [Candidatus Levybacteria bacterium]|nr:S8 family serine peptidase [Candidatus Levybacteria bacterium]
MQALGVEKYEPVFDSDDPTLMYHYRLALKKGSDVQKIREALYKLDEIESSEPDYYIETQAVPNDPQYPTMWSLQKIQAENAWNINKGSNEITVAVIDTGVDYNHPDFKGRTFVAGKDFVTCDNILISGGQGQCIEPRSMDNDPMDDMGHGTHVAGTIGAVSNNGVGVSGINWNVKFMALKTMNKNRQAGGSIPDAIRHAADNGADVINMSLGGVGDCASNSSYQTVINYARNKGVVVIVAAGNGDKQGNPILASRFFPANCQGVIAVGATGSNDERASYSNYGSPVTLAAPGGNRKGAGCSPATCILSTVPGGKYNAEQGTSMAAPHVAGVAALVLAQNPSFGPDDVKKCLVDSADTIKTDMPIGKRLNAYYALNGCTRSDSPVVTGSITTTPTTVLPTEIPGSTSLSYYIKGSVYDDKNKNLTKDADEGMLSGATVVLKGPVSKPTVTTGADGSFVFNDLEPGSYRVEASVGGKPIMEYRFTLNRTLPNIALPVPVIVQPSQDGSPDTPGQPGDGITGTPSPTPRQLFTCKEETTNRQVNNKTIQIKYLKCTPK